MDKNTPIFTYYQFREGKAGPVQAEVVVEAPVSLTVNGEVWLTLLCTPVDLEALAVGFLHNEGLIESAADLASVRVCKTGDNVDVWTTASLEKPKAWRRTTGCTGGQTSVAGNSAVSNRYQRANGVALAPQQITRLITLLFDAQDLYRKSGGVHTSALSDGNQLLVVTEDIGRHNTLDKIAGRCLLQGLHPAHSILLTTGRISSEMLQKAVRIGAAVVISRTSPSSLSIELAGQAGITLIGYARRTGFNIYTHPERVLTAVTQTEDCAIPRDR